jgi:hypothetical protein
MPLLDGWGSTRRMRSLRDCVLSGNVRIWILVPGRECSADRLYRSDCRKVGLADGGTVGLASVLAIGENQPPPSRHDRVAALIIVQGREEESALRARASRPGRFVPAVARIAGRSPEPGRLCARTNGRDGARGIAEGMEIECGECAEVSRSLLKLEWAICPDPQ